MLRLSRSARLAAIWLLGGWVTSVLAAAPAFIALPEKEECVEVCSRKEVEVPAGRVVRAWTAVSAVHEFVLCVNGEKALSR